MCGIKMCGILMVAHLQCKHFHGDFNPHDASVVNRVGSKVRLRAWVHIGGFLANHMEFAVNFKEWMIKGFFSVSFLASGFSEEIIEAIVKC